MMKVYAIYDSKAKSFMLPFFAVNAAVATRQFSAAVNDPQSEFYRFSEDYSLFEIGEFSADDGVIAGYDHANLGLAASYKKVEM